MKSRIQAVYGALRGSFWHPQWLTDRLHVRSRQALNPLRNAVILDVGSGDSDNIRYVDDSNTIIRLDYPGTNSSYRSRPDVFADARHLPVMDRSIDVVLLFEVLEHVYPGSAVLAEIQRVLRHGGTLFLSVPFLYPIHDAPNDFQRFTIHGIRLHLEHSGFRVITEIQHGNSLLVPIQLMNLALLEACRSLLIRTRWAGFLAMLIAYPLCLINNLLALPMTLLPEKGAGCFGYFVVAERK
jgi:SAM-dependent methyltransferase